MFLKIGATMLLATLGCTSPIDYIRNGFQVGPNYRRPPAATAKDWIDASDQRIREDADEPRDWWKLLNDPALDSLITDAYRQNLTLREAGYRVLAARANLGFAVGEIFPQTQEATGDYSRNTMSRENANRGFLGDRTYDQWSFGFNLAWELDFWGRFRRAIEQAEAEMDASVENYDDVLVTLLGDVASNYVQLRTLEQQMAYVRTNVQLQRETLDLANARFQSGESSELDVDQAQSTLSQTESQIPQLEITSRQASNRLCVLMGIPPRELQSRLGIGAIPTAPRDVIVGIPANLLRRRPDVRREERLAAAQCAAIGIAESDFYPAISITGNLGWSARQFEDQFQSSAFNGSVGPSFAWKVLNYGRILSNYRLQQAQFEQAVAKYENTVLQANEEVENGIVRFLKSQQSTTFLNESVDAAKKAVDVALAQYKSGLVDFNRVSLLEQNLVEQQDQSAQASGNIAQGLIDVYRALGGGWQIREQFPQDTRFEELKTREEIKSWEPSDYKPKSMPGIPEGAAGVTDVESSGQ